MTSTRDPNFDFGLAKLPNQNKSIKIQARNPRNLRQDLRFKAPAIKRVESAIFNHHHEEFLIKNLLRGVTMMWRPGFLDYVLTRLKRLGLKNLGKIFLFILKPKRA